MARIIKGILGPVNGKVGTVIGGSWNGVDYIRSLPRPSSRVASPKQLEQRARFALAIVFLKPVSFLLERGFKGQRSKSTGFNEAVAYHLKNAMSGDYPDLRIDYSKVIFSRGYLTPPSFSGLGSAGADITLSWLDNSGSGLALPGDKAIVLLYNTAKKLYVLGMDSVSRKAGSQVVKVPADFSGDELQAYMAFTSADGKLLSTSVYAGAVTVA